MTKESAIESNLKSSVESHAGLCIKLNPLNLVGIPDRIVLLPGGWLAFVEVKKPKGGRIGGLQVIWRKKLIALGFRHFFVLTRDDVALLIANWRGLNTADDPH